MKSYSGIVLTLCLVGGLLFNCSEPADAANRVEINRKQVAASLRKAVIFFQDQVSVQGGYLWRYSADLKKREGEGKASAMTAWVQPPGTPSVGEALLRAYHRTGDRHFRDAARQQSPWSEDNYAPAVGIIVLNSIQLCESDIRTAPTATNPGSAM